MRKVLALCVSLFLLTSCGDVDSSDLSRLEPVEEGADNVKLGDDPIVEDPIVEDPVDAEPEPPEPQNKKILLIGDSLSSSTKYGLKLVDFFKEPGAYCETETLAEKPTVKSFAVPSSAVRHYSYKSGTNKNWLCDQKTLYRNGTAKNTSAKRLCNNTNDLSVFEKINSDFSADVLVFSLGTNSLAFSASYVRGETLRILDQVKEGQSCIWVAPTLVSSKYSAKLKRTVGAIKNIIESHPSNCLYIESFAEFTKQKDCSRFNVGDGIHHTSCGSELWADHVIDSACKNL